VNTVGLVNKCLSTSLTSPHVPVPGCTSGMVSHSHSPRPCNPLSRHPGSKWRRRWNPMTNETSHLEGQDKARGSARALAPAPTISMYRHKGACVTCCRPLFAANIVTRARGEVSSSRPCTTLVSAHHIHDAKRGGKENTTKQQKVTEAQP
jgi:hypothetical protein